MDYKFDTQLLIAGENLSEDEIHDYIAGHFPGDCLLAIGDSDLIKIHFHTNEPWQVLQYCAGLRLPPFTREQWASVYFSDFIYDMPCWPAAGSVIMHEGVAVVKLGEIEPPQ